MRHSKTFAGLLFLSLAACSDEAEHDFEMSPLYIPVAVVGGVVLAPVVLVAMVADDNGEPVCAVTPTSTTLVDLADAAAEPPAEDGGLDTPE